MEDRKPTRRGGRLARPWRQGWLRTVPGIGRLRALRPGTDAHVGALVDAFAAFATLDGILSPVEADLILDMLRSAFPEVDHGWLGRRLQRAVRHPRPLHGLGLELRDSLDDRGKLAVGLQLFTLVDSAGKSERSRASFEVFMRRLGRPDYGTAISREMSGVADEEELPFERVIFGGAGADVRLPGVSGVREFRVYRTGDLMLVRNTGGDALWVRGRALPPGGFMRIRERQPLVVPGWTLSQEDLAFFLNVRRTSSAPLVFLHSGPDGLEVERVRTRQSEVRVRFGQHPEVEGLRGTLMRAEESGLILPGKVLQCRYHERLRDRTGFSVTLDDLRRQALRSGRRFRLADDRQEYLVSNDASALTGGDLLVAPRLAPRFVMFIRFDAAHAQGELEVRESEGPVSVDGVLVKGRVPLVDGSLIRLSGSQAVRCRFSEGLLDEERTQIESLEVESLIHDFGRDSRALDHLSFEVKRGEMVCIIGPSGSGKSTLLAALSGQRRPQSGIVRLNGLPLYDHWDNLVPFIAYMPQEEALNPQLTVREHLRHAVTIRRPAVSLAEHERRVDSILAELGLQTISRRRVGSQGEKTISGGERSRLNLGLDLGSRAEVLLFDEPISGLSSKDSEHVAETLRALAREKIVIASLHRPGSPVLRLFDKVLLLDRGGRLAYFGTPVGMVGYFRDACTELGISHPASGSGATAGADFVFDVLETPLNAIGDGANSGAARRFSPGFWQERYERVVLLNSLLPGSPAQPGPIGIVGRVIIERELPVPPRPTRRVWAGFAIFITHFNRSFLSKVRNRGTLYSTFLEAPLLAALVAITLRSSPQGAYQFTSALHIPAYLFLSATVAMFLGLTNSATEILRDRPVLRRERNCQSGAGSYVAAKLVALCLVAAVQCLMYVVVGNHFLEIRGMVAEHWLCLTVTAWAGTAIALLISAWVRTERAALTAVPLLLVPQMLLAGALVPYKEMNRGLFDSTRQHRDRGGAPVPAEWMPLRYSYEALIVTQAVRNPFEIERIRLQRRIDRFRNRNLTAEESERFRLVKGGLQRLLAAGATNSRDAARLASRIRRAAMAGSPADLETMKIWPDGADEDRARPISEFFVNERIDLMVREAESYRNDYRNLGKSDVFLALRKPSPFDMNGGDSPSSSEPTGATDPANIEPFVEEESIDTLRYCGLTLAGIIFGCGMLTSVTVSRQNRRTK